MSHDENSEIENCFIVKRMHNIKLRNGEVIYFQVIFPEKKVKILVGLPVLILEFWVDVT